MQARHIALAITRILPGWLSSLALAALFMTIWLDPTIFGWNQMHGLRALVYTEVVVVYGALFMLAGNDEPFAWLPVVPVALVIGVALARMVSPLVATLVASHVVLRVAGIWSDVRSRQTAVRWLVYSLSVMIAVGLFVSVWPLAEFGWTVEDTPREFWWEVPGPMTNRRIPFGLPAWGFVYFLVTGLTGASLYVGRWMRSLWESVVLKAPRGT